MNKTFLSLLGVVGALVVLVGAYTTSLYWRAGSIEDARAQEEKQLEANADAYYADVARATEARLAKEAADTYGGTTPEETWSLFIAALEQEDVELAAKYFVVDRQEERKVFLEKERSGNTLQTLLSSLKTAKSEGYSYDNEQFVFTAKSKNSGGLYEYTLQINPQTHVWKILSL
jgi:hypothetical protein